MKVTFSPMGKRVLGILIGTAICIALFALPFAMGAACRGINTPALAAGTNQSREGSRTQSHEPTVPVPPGMPPPVAVDRPGPRPFSKEFISNYFDWRNKADTAAWKGNWGWWESFMGVHHLSYEQARKVVDWQAASEQSGHSYLVEIGAGGLSGINTRPKSGHYEPFRAWLKPGDHVVVLDPRNPFLSRPVVFGDGFRAGCGNPWASLRLVAGKGGHRVPEALPRTPAGPPSKPPTQPPGRCVVTDPNGPSNPYTHPPAEHRAGGTRDYAGNGDHVGRSQDRARRGGTTPTEHGTRGDGAGGTTPRGGSDGPSGSERAPAPTEDPVDVGVDQTSVGGDPGAQD